MMSPDGDPRLFRPPPAGARGLHRIPPRNLGFTWLTRGLGLSLLRLRLLSGRARQLVFAYVLTTRSVIRLPYTTFVANTPACGRTRRRAVSGREAPTPDLAARCAPMQANCRHLPNLRIMRLDIKSIKCRNLAWLKGSDRLTRNFTECAFEASQTNVRRRPYMDFLMFIRE